MQVVVCGAGGRARNQPRLDLAVAVVAEEDALANLRAVRRQRLGGVHAEGESLRHGVDVMKGEVDDASALSDAAFAAPAPARPKGGGHQMLPRTYVRTERVTSFARRVPNSARASSKTGNCVALLRRKVWV